MTWHDNESSWFQKRFECLKSKFEKTLRSNSTGPPKTDVCKFTFMRHGINTDIICKFCTTLKTVSQLWRQNNTSVYRHSSTTLKIRRTSNSLRCRQHDFREEKGSWWRTSHLNFPFTNIFEFQGIFWNGFLSPKKGLRKPLMKFQCEPEPRDSRGKAKGR